MDAVRGLCEYLKYGTPSMLMLVQELWSFEVLMLLAGFLGPTYQAVHVIMLNIDTVLFQVSLGIAIAVSNKVGNSLGEGLPKVAKTYFYISLIITLFFAIIFMTGCTLFRYQIPRIYTSHEEVIGIVGHILPMLGLFTSIDIFQGSMSGAILAMGYQNFSIWANFISYWLIGLPLTYYIMFPLKYGVYGMWTGMTLGTFLVGFSYLCKIYFTDWEKLSATIIDRIDKEKTELNDICSVIIPV